MARRRAPGSGRRRTHKPRTPGSSGRRCARRPWPGPRPRGGWVGRQRGPVAAAPAAGRRRCAPMLGSLARNSNPTR